jgi:excisionase family DNA binding protein
MRTKRRRHRNESPESPPGDTDPESPITPAIVRASGAQSPPPMPAEPPAMRRAFYTPQELADLFQVSYHAVLRAIDRGDLEAERVFNRLRISADSVEAYRAASRVPSRTERSHQTPAVERESRRRRPRNSGPPGAGSLAALRAIERGGAG